MITANAPEWADIIAAEWEPVALGRAKFGHYTYASPSFDGVLTLYWPMGTRSREWADVIYAKLGQREWHLPRPW